MEVLYVMTEELRGLPRGIHIPEAVGFEGFEVQTAPLPHLGVRVQVKGKKPIELNHDDVLRMDRRNHSIKRIVGPSFYEQYDQIKMIVAGSSFGVSKHLRFCNDGVAISKEYYAKKCASVLMPNGKWYRTYDDVPAKQGKLVVVYSEPTEYLPTKYHLFLVREDYREDQEVIDSLKSLMSKYPRKPSGVFDNVTKRYWEPWLLSAAKEYYGASKNEAPKKSATARKPYSHHTAYGAQLAA